MPTKEMDEQKPIKWTFAEIEKHERSQVWYIGMGVFAGALLLYAVLTGNWLFALIIIMIGMVMVINDREGSRDIEIDINHDGIIIDDKKYEYIDIENFWIVYQPPEVKNLYISFKSPLRFDVTVHLEKQNPVDVRAFLRQYLQEDLEKEEQSFADAFGRLLKM